MYSSLSTALFFCCLTLTIKSTVSTLKVLPNGLCENVRLCGDGNFLFTLCTPFFTSPTKFADSVLWRSLVVFGAKTYSFPWKKCRESRFSLQQVVKRVLERNVTLGQKVDEQSTDLFSKPQRIPDILIECVEIYGCFEKVTLSTRRTSVSTVNEKDRYIYNDEGVVLQVSHIFLLMLVLFFMGVNLIPLPQFTMTLSHPRL